MGTYEFALLGAFSESARRAIRRGILDSTEPFGLEMGKDVVVHDRATIDGRDLGSAFAAVYFAGDASQDTAVAERLVSESAPVIPYIDGVGLSFEGNLPEFLLAANGLRRRTEDTEHAELISALLECVGLLRRQRRVFVSYRRTESRAAAVQMHDVLTERCFDVFLDTHDIRPGDAFQEVLWHRLVDSDVVVMLDTPGYFESRWTRAEIGRARAKEIQVLRVIWPDHQPTQLTALSDTLYLEHGDLVGPDGPILPERAQTIALQVETLRSRSIAARFMSLTGKFRADVSRIGGKILGIGAHRAITVQLLDDRTVWAYPVVGVPTAESLNDVAEKARISGGSNIPILIYDHLGIHSSWSAHLKWLDEQIRTVRAVKVSDVAWELADWERAT